MKIIKFKVLIFISIMNANVYAYPYYVKVDKPIIHKFQLYESDNKEFESYEVQLIILNRNVSIRDFLENQFNLPANSPNDQESRFYILSINRPLDERSISALDDKLKVIHKNLGLVNVEIKNSSERYAMIERYDSMSLALANLNNVKVIYSFYRSPNFNYYNITGKSGTINSGDSIIDFRLFSKRHQYSNLYAKSNEDGSVDVFTRYSCNKMFGYTPTIYRIIGDNYYSFTSNVFIHIRGSLYFWIISDSMIINETGAKLPPIDITTYNDMDFNRLKMTHMNPILKTFHDHAFTDIHWRERCVIGYDEDDECVMFLGVVSPKLLGRFRRYLNC